MMKVFNEILLLLRGMTGLTQTKFAEELNEFGKKAGLCERESTIFQKKKILKLENGQQEPKLTDIQIISAYFYLNPNDLFTKEGFKKAKIMYEWANCQIDYAFIIPIFSSNTNSELFKKTYGMHCEILAGYKKEDEAKLKECLDNYIACWEKHDNIMPSMANYLSLLLFKGFISFSTSNINKEKLLKTNNATLKNLFGIVYDVDSLTIENKHAFSKNDYINIFIEELNDGGFSEFVDFFNAGCLLIGFAENEKSYFENVAIVKYLLKDLYNKENRYVILQVYLTLTNFNTIKDNDLLKNIANDCECIFDELETEGVQIRILNNV